MDSHTAVLADVQLGAARRIIEQDIAMYEKRRRNARTRTDRGELTAAINALHLVLQAMRVIEGAVA
jgi:hypothetical protein